MSEKNKYTELGEACANRLNPLITILIPTFQRPEMLRRSVESVLTQSFQQFILKVYDNGSDIETVRVMDEYKDDQRVFYLRHKQNLGAQENAKRLFESVSTEFYIFISDDDFMLPGHLERGISALTTNKQCSVYFSPSIVVNTTSQLVKHVSTGWMEGAYTPSIDSLKKVSRDHFISTSTIFSRKLRPNFPMFHAFGLDDVFSVLLVGCFTFYVSQTPGAVFMINHDGDRYRNVRDFPLDKILNGEAFDKSLVTSNASSELRDSLLMYLRRIYTHYLDLRLDYLGRGCMPSASERNLLDLFPYSRYYFLVIFFQTRMLNFRRIRFFTYLINLRNFIFKRELRTSKIPTSYRLSKTLSCQAKRYIYFSDLSQRDAFVECIRKCFNINFE